VTGSLLLGIVGLAALDALNASTIVAVALILVATRRRPRVTALVTVLGAALTVFGSGVALFLPAGAAAETIDGILQGIRYVVFAAVGLVVIVSGVRRFHSRTRTPIVLPAWFTPWTALPFGILLTGADLPGAFPYLIAIERLLDAHLTTGEGLLIVAGYTVIYCSPCLLLLSVAGIAHQRTQTLLPLLAARFGTGNSNPSPLIAVTLILLGGLIASLPFWALR
jgi:hypothetical protein